MPRRTMVTDSDRKRLIDKFNENEDFLTTAQELGIKRTTAYSIISKYVKTGEIYSRHGGGRYNKVDNEMIDFLLMLIEATPTITLRELNENLRTIFTNKPRCCDSTIARALEGELITLKKVHDVPAQRNSDETKEARSIYADWMYREGLGKHRVYIDEMGFNLYTRRTYGRSPRGEKVSR